MISLIPYDALPGFVSSLKALRLMRLLKLFKLLRVLRAGRIFKRIEVSMVIHYGKMKLVNFFFVVMFSAHLMVREGEAYHVTLSIIRAFACVT